jgi:hypothetical protein
MVGPLGVKAARNKLQQNITSDPFHKACWIIQVLELNKTLGINKGVVDTKKAKFLMELGFFILKAFLGYWQLF